MCSMRKDDNYWSSIKKSIYYANNFQTNRIKFALIKTNEISVFRVIYQQKWIGLNMDS